MAEPVRAGQVLKSEALRDGVWQPDILEHLNALAKVENAEPGMMREEPGKE
jgi:hypothetical protein